MSEQLPRYDRHETYRWNYEHAPKAIDQLVAPMPGDWRFCGRSVESPLGVAAGPLLNGKWCLYYAGLGFDVLTYKTVRSGQRDCYPLPNLQPVNCGDLTGHEARLSPSPDMGGSWAVSFGMPSAAPETWRRDIEWTRHHLAAEKVLAVSVVGTMQDGWTIEQLADDYAQCAAWAVESGADCIETNFSCPNVTTCDGQLYLDANASNQVARTVKAAIGPVPLIIKIGHLDSVDQTAMLLDAVSEEATALAMTNSIATTIGHSDDSLLFDRQQRGICGRGIRDSSIAQVERFSQQIDRRQSSLEIIGVGGVERASDLQRYLSAGASACHSATAVMTDPSVALRIRAELSA
ncbi:MAG: hypothetical protein ACR2NZ_22365 [Rubripirellula sp.]